MVICQSLLRDILVTSKQMDNDKNINAFLARRRRGINHEWITKLCIVPRITQNFLCQMATIIVCCYQNSSERGRNPAPKEAGKLS